MTGPAITRPEINLINYPTILQEINPNVSKIPQKIGNFEDLKIVVENFNYFVALNFLNKFEDDLVEENSISIEENFNKNEIFLKLSKDGSSVSEFLKRLDIFHSIITCFKNTDQKIKENNLPTILWWELRSLLIYNKILSNNSLPGKTFRSETI